MDDTLFTGYYNQFAQSAELDKSINVNSVPAFISWLDANVNPAQNVGANIPLQDATSIDLTPTNPQ